MKPAWFGKLLFVIACGVVFGRYIQSDFIKWNHMGRDAFLSYEAHRFDHYMAYPGTGTKYVIICIVFAVGLAALYEGIAYVVTQSFQSLGSGDQRKS